MIPILHILVDCQWRGCPGKARRIYHFPNGNGPGGSLNFHACSRFPNLQRFGLIGNLEAPLCSHLTSRTTSTALLLHFDHSSPLIASQLNSILVSNPSLQDLSPRHAALPNDIDKPGLRVPLQHLKTIELVGDFRSAFWLLRWLEFPETLDCMSLGVANSTAEDVYETLVPCMQDFFRGDIGFNDRLKVVSFCGISVNPVDRPTKPSRAILT